MSNIAERHGLFQVIFAHLTDQLSGLTFHMRRLNEPGLKFDNVFRQELSKTLKQLRSELNKLVPPKDLQYEDDLAGYGKSERHYREQYLAEAL